MWKEEDAVTENHLKATGGYVHKTANMHTVKALLLSVNPFSFSSQIKEAVG